MLGLIINYFLHNMFQVKVHNYDKLPYLKNLFLDPYFQYRWDLLSTISHFQLYYKLFFLKPGLPCRTKPPRDPSESPEAV